MAIRPIVITGNPVLHSRASEVTVFDDELRSLVADMYDTMDKAPGVGLAAPQVGIPLRIFVYDFADDEGNERRGVLINPVLEIGPIVDEPADEDTEVEGCLSVPGERFPLKRAETAVVSGVDLEQKPVRIEADGWFARIFQHEFDHLDGNLYVDKLRDEFKGEVEEIKQDEGWGVDGLSWMPGKDDLDA